MWERKAINNMGKARIIQIIIIIIIIIMKKKKVCIISTHQPMYWRMTISSCAGTAAYLRTKQ
jgi:hypothetical protein